MAELRMEHIYKFYDQNNRRLMTLTFILPIRNLSYSSARPAAGNQRRCEWSQDLKKFRKAIFILKENGSMM